MSEEKFLQYVWDVYYYSLDERWNELRNILFAFTNECNSKSAMLLLYLAKHNDFEYLFDYMDTLRRGIEIDLKPVEEECITAIHNGELDFAKYLIGFMSSRGKGTHQEVNIPYVDFAYNYKNYKLNNKRYSSVDDDLDIEDELYDELQDKRVIKDIVSPDRLTSLKKEFMMGEFNNIDTYTCTDRKGQYHTYAKVNEEIEDIDIEQLLADVDHQIYLSKMDKAKSLVKTGLLKTKGFDPDLVRAYNDLYNDPRIERLERHICPPRVEDDSYNILYDFNYNIKDIDALVNFAFRNKELDLSNYTDEEKGLIYAIISREAYKRSDTKLGVKYFRLACNYYKKYPEVNYFLKYIDDNKGNLNYQVVRSLSDAVRLELKLK